MSPPCTSCAAFALYGAGAWRRLFLFLRSIIETRSRTRQGPLFGFDVRVLYHFRPAPDLGRDRLAEFVGRARDDLEAHRRKSLLGVRRAQHAGELGVELVHDRF